MKDLIVIEHREKRVLTTAQLAESYGTSSDRISKNFSENKERYKEGKHYILLQGEDLKRFKNDFRNSELVGKNASALYLWTEKGAWLHAKSLNTDEAWDAYEMLVDEYYKVVEQQQRIDTSKLSPELQMFNQLFLSVAETQLKQQEQDKRLNEMEQQQLEIKQQQENIKEIVALNPTEWRKKTTAILNKIAIARGGFGEFKNVRQESYDLLESRARCKLDIRLNNRKKEALANGIIPKSKINKMSKLDVIADDARLTEIYLAIVKEMAIKYQINAEGLGA